MAEKIEGHEIADSYITLLTHVLENGEIVKDERGSLTVEVENTLTFIKNPLGVFEALQDIGAIQIPRNKKTGKLYFWNGTKLMDYCIQFRNPKNENGHTYTYGNRLRGHFKEQKIDEYQVHEVGAEPPHEWEDTGKRIKQLIEGKPIDQINVAIDRLKNCPESRRAVSVTWDASKDTKVNEVPCLIIVDFKIRKGKLNTTALWRSHDIYGAFFPNVAGLTYLAQYVAENVGIDIGTVTVHSISAHVYEKDYQEACELVGIEPTLFQS
jgi:thymidylate synthase